MFLAAGQEDGVKEREGGGSGGVVKTQAGVPFCWPESGSSHVLLQHSQQHHTVRQKVKGR